MNWHLAIHIYILILLYYNKIAQAHTHTLSTVTYYIPLDEAKTKFHHKKLSHAIEKKWVFQKAPHSERINNHTHSRTQRMEHDGKWIWILLLHCGIAYLVLLHPIQMSCALWCSIFRTPCTHTTTTTSNSPWKLLCVKLLFVLFARVPAKHR